MMHRYLKHRFGRDRGNNLFAEGMRLTGSARAVQDVYKFRLPV